jgi:hypothetical protein
MRDRLRVKNKKCGGDSMPMHEDKILKEGRINLIRCIGPRKECDRTEEWPQVMSFLRYVKAQRLRKVNATPQGQPFGVYLGHQPRTKEAMKG